MKRIFLLLLLGSALFTGAGCQTRRMLNHTLKPAASYHSPAEGIPMRRVAMLPLAFEHPGAGISDMEQSFQAELSKTGTLEIVPVSHAELEGEFGRREFVSTEKLPADLLAKLAAKYGADGVMFTDVTHYFPYRPISIGIRAKLVDARTGGIRWAFDHVFDSGNPQIAAAAKQFYLEQSFDNSPLKGDGSPILQSPSRFAKFVAHEAYRSLLEKPLNP